MTAVAAARLQRNGGGSAGVRLGLRPAGRSGAGSQLAPRTSHLITAAQRQRRRRRRQRRRRQRRRRRPAERGDRRAPPAMQGRSEDGVNEQSRPREPATAKMSCGKRQILKRTVGCETQSYCARSRCAIASAHSQQARSAAIRTACETGEVARAAGGEGFGTGDWLPPLRCRRPVAMRMRDKRCDANMAVRRASQLVGKLGAMDIDCWLWSTELVNRGRT